MTKEEAAENTRFSKEIFEAICKRIADGESINKICSEKDMPAQANFYRWLQKDSALREIYAQARQDQAEKYLDEIIEIADNCTDDIMFLTSEDSSGEGASAKIKHSAINRARLQIDARKWAMSKLAPKKYGDKLALSGDDEAPPVGIAVHFVKSKQTE